MLRKRPANLPCRMDDEPVPFAQHEQAQGVIEIRVGHQNAGHPAAANRSRAGRKRRK